MSNNTYNDGGKWNKALNALPKDQRGYYKLSVIAAVERQKMGTNSFRPLNVVANTHSPQTGHPWQTANITNVRASSREVPSGIINGVNTNFSVAHGTVDPLTMFITIDDVPLNQGTDYVISGATKQNIAFVIAPANNSIIYTYYGFGT